MDLAGRETAARALEDAEKDHSAAIRELQAQIERKISEAEKGRCLFDGKCSQ